MSCGVQRRCFPPHIHTISYMVVIRSETHTIVVGPACVRFRQMTAVGCYGKAGLDRNSIILRPKLFPKKEVSPKASPRAKAK